MFLLFNLSYFCFYLYKMLWTAFVYEMRSINKLCFHLLVILSFNLLCSLFSFLLIFYLNFFVFFGLWLFFFLSFSSDFPVSFSFWPPSPSPFSCFVNPPVCFRTQRPLSLRTEHCSCCLTCASSRPPWALGWRRGKAPDRSRTPGTPTLHLSPLLLYSTGSNTDQNSGNVLCGILITV